MSNPLLDLLIKSESLSEDTMELIKRYMKKWNSSSFDSLLDCNIYSEPTLSDILSSVLAIERVYHLDKEDIDMEAFIKFPFGKLKNLLFVPLICSVNENIVKVALADPTNQSNIDFIQSVLGKELLICVAEKALIANTINDYYPIESQFERITGL